MNSLRIVVALATLAAAPLATIETASAFPHCGPAHCIRGVRIHRHCVAWEVFGGERHCARWVRGW